MRRAARTDSNQTAIVEALRGMECSVAITSALGDGFPDLVVGYYGMNLLIEVKDGSKPKAAQHLTEDQARLHSSWKGTIRTVYSAQEACDVIREEWDNGQA